MDDHASLQAVYLDPSFSKYGKPCDTHLKTDDGTVFQVYSDLLSRKSQFFNALFSIDEETGQSTVIHGIESSVLEDILVYLYTGRLNLTTENMLHLLVASDFLMIDPLLNECKKFVLQNKTVKNCVILYLTAYRIKGLDIECQCRRFFLICFENAVMHSVNEAFSLPFEALKRILSHRSLNVCCERFIWSFIETWVVQKDPNNRLSYFPEIFRFLSINDVNASLASDIIRSPLVKNAMQYDNLGHLDEALKYLCDICKSKPVSIIKGISEFPFITSVRLPPFLYLVTKNSPQRLVAEVFISYDDSLDFFRKLREMPLNRGGLMGVANLVHILRETEFGKSVFAGRTYDLLTNELRTMTTCPRNSLHVVAEAAGVLFALEMVGRTVFQYLEETDEWIRVSHMQEMYVQGAVGLNGLLYVVGETNEMIMQVYDHSTDRWSEASPPNVRRYNTTAVVYQGKIFLLGGEYDRFPVFDVDDDDFDEEDIGEGNEEPFDNPEAVDDDMDLDEDFVEYDDDEDVEEDDDVEDVDFVSRDVEVYDPDEDEWFAYPELPFKCDEMVAVVIRERLYVYNNYPSPVAYWDGTGQWKVVDNPHIQSQMFQYRFCAIEKEEVIKEMMKGNREANTSIWRETGLEKDID